MVVFYESCEYSFTSLFRFSFYIKMVRKKDIITIKLNGKKKILDISANRKISVVRSRPSSWQYLPRRSYHRPGDLALKEIRQYQKSTERIISKAPFQRLIRQITEEYEHNIRYQVAALEVLHVKLSLIS